MTSIRLREVVGVSADQPLAPEAKEALCSKAEIILTEQEEIQDGEENQVLQSRLPSQRPFTMRRGILLQVGELQTTLVR